MRFTTEVPAEFQCKVCSDPWDPESAVNCSSCESVFCHRCHLESMAKDAQCFHCGKQPSTFTQPHRLLRSMAANLEVLCDNQPYGCNWTGPRSQFTSHMSVCDKRAKQFHYLPDAKIPAELLCPICHDPMVDPVQLKCEHAFCKHCITLALQVSATCPIDRAEATPADFSQPPKAISSLLDDLSVQCPNHAATPPCTWTGKRHEVKAHACAPTPTEPTSNPLPVPEKPADPTPAPAPTKEMQLEAIPEFPSLEASNLDQEVYVLAHLTAPIMTSVEDRKKPLSLSAVIDVSGSMAGEKLAMAKESLKFMIKELSERDELGIIAFESEVEETLPTTKMDSVGKERALAAAESLKEKGCTNLSGGLFSGVAQVDHQPFGTPGRTGSPPPVAAQVAAQVRPKSGGLSSLFSRMSEAAYGRKAPPPPPRPEAKLRSVFWLTKMKRDGKQLYQYTVDLTVNAPVLSNVLIQPHGQGKLAEKRINPTSASQSSTWESTAPVTHWAFTAVLPPTSVAPGEPNSFNFQHMMADQEQQEASFTIPGRGAEPAPAPAKSKKRDDCGAVMVFTDGAANRGLCDPTKLAEALTDHLSKATPMVVHTFGFGSDHNATLLQKLAEIGAGSYYFIQDVGTMKESFADCLGGLMSTAAQNISLEIQPEPGFKIDKVLTTLQLSTDRGYPVVSMRDVYSGEKRDILVRLKMDRNREVGSTAPVVRFTVKYDSLLSAKQEAVNTVCAVAFAAAKSVAPPNILVDQQRARILVSEAIAKAREIADSGNVVAAQNMMRSAMNNVSSCVSASSPYVQAMRTDLASLEAKMATPSMWVASGSKAAAQVQSCHVQQRQNFSAECEDLGYDNAFKKEMRSKARK